MNWTTPADLRAQVLKLWNRGILLASMVSGTPIFPRRLIVKGPTSVELAQRFDEVRGWIAGLKGQAKPCRVVWRDINHRVLGSNSVPDEVWIDTLEDALGLIGKNQDAERFAAMVAITGERHPELLSWLGKRPLRALELANEWPKLLDIVAWRRQHPKPDIYLRQVDISGVHSKFIEDHRAVLSELLDLVLLQNEIDDSARGVSGFCRRYGFRDKPTRIRFRILDSDIAFVPSGTDQDIMVTNDTFAQLDLPVEKVFITENEINFLAFPSVPSSMAIFGAGYGFEMLADALWLQSRCIYYWGDIDTHGFAILDQIRALFPNIKSFLMDHDTLLAHQPQWGKEPQPERRDLPRLNSTEVALYNDLRQNRLGIQLRLEQERIGFAWVEAALKKL
ncbi:MAG: hypothetical protein HYV24_00850 [Deltaproteobacteria bacterium]|nr:hypothetical protein [Deltaproteobacteria bacterium]